MFMRGILISLLLLSAGVVRAAEVLDGIRQPPVHALALQRIWQLTPQPQRPEIRARYPALYPRLVSGIMTLLPSATPRHRDWSPSTTRAGHGQLPALGPRAGAHRGAEARPVHPRGHRHQLGDPSQRPTDWDYDRYLWLVGLLRKYRYDDAEIYPPVPVSIQGRVLQRRPRRGERRTPRPGRRRRGQ